MIGFMGSRNHIFKHCFIEHHDYIMIQMDRRMKFEFQFKFDLIVLLINIFC
jgi:hypothetical protein